MGPNGVAKASLVFVYNAEAGLFHALADTAHKLLSPDTYACALCAVTHGLTGEKRSWRTYLDGLGRPLRFYHRADFHAAHPEGTNEPLPAVFLDGGDGLLLLLSDAEIAATGDLGALIAALDRALSRRPASGAS
jgi:hypothetical protein